jgi:hypothetical protein
MKDDEKLYAGYKDEMKIEVNEFVGRLEKILEKS